MGYTIEYMIASLTGSLLSHNEKFCILQVGGVGYKVYASPETLAYCTLDKEVFLYIYTVVREDAFELYGFKNESSQDMFEKLIGISGIGPRAALSVMSAASVDTLRSAIGRGDLAYLTKVSGIGKKTAEKILLELRDKMGTQYDENITDGNNDDGDVVLALESLGYTLVDARAAAKSVSQDTIGTNNKIKEALKNLIQ